MESKRIGVGWDVNEIPDELTREGLRVKRTTCLSEDGLQADFCVLTIDRKKCVAEYVEVRGELDLDSGKYHGRERRAIFEGWDEIRQAYAYYEAFIQNRIHLLGIDEQRTIPIDLFGDDEWGLFKGHRK